jgi:serine/threonine protein kinase
MTKKRYEKYPMKNSTDETFDMYDEQLQKMLGSRLSKKDSVEYNRKTPIGKGRDGQVFTCVIRNSLQDGDLREDDVHRRYVIKEMYFPTPPKHSTRPQLVTKLDKFLRKCMFELRILLFYEHDECVVKAVGGFLDKDTTSDRVYFGIIMEKMETSLHDYLIEVGTISVVKAAQISLELVSLAKFTEKKLGFVHNDLHSKNVLCNADGTHLKICDFGHAASFGGKDDVAPRGKEYEVNTGVLDANSKHVGRKHNSVSADASCDHYSLAYMILCVLHGYYHEIIKLFRYNGGQVYSPYPDEGVFCNRSQKTRLCVGQFKHVATLVQPVTLLLKDCIENGTMLQSGTVTEALNALVANDEAGALDVRFIQ